MTGALRVGSFSPSIPLRVARAGGLLARRGLAVDERPVRSSPDQFRALLGGDLDAALTSPDNVLAYRYLPVNPLRRTADVRILLGVDRGLGLSLFGRPGLRDPTEIRGGVVGVDVARSGFAFVLYAILARAGLRLGRDYQVAELGSTPRRLGALRAGECLATMLNAGSDLRAEADGCVRLRRATEVCHPYLGTVLAATGEACERDAARLAGLVGALREAIRTLAGGGARQLASAEAAAALGLDPVLARRYVAGLVDPADGLVPTGEPDDASLTTVIALRRRHTAANWGGPDPPADPPADPLADLAAPFQGLVDRRFLDPG
jgi:ABC-type nitrate/sulfonate/bicarbonate transport system substrate-binding protein